MARPTKLLAALRDLVRREVHTTIQTMFSLAGATKPTTTTRRRRKATNGRRKRRGPGRPPKNVS